VPAPPTTAATSAPADTPDAPSTYNVDRARRERYEADLAELKLREQQGDLVRVVEVRAEISKRVGQVRMNLLQIPARLAPLLATEADQAKVHALLDAEIRSVLTAVSAT
jgi:phage terminase Nu1 subunit (DNA packaging protein)